MPIDIRDAIQETNERFSDYIHHRDAVALSALYTPDAVLLPPNHDFIEGSSPICEFWQGIMAMGVTDARLETIELHGFGDMAVEIGKYTLRASRRRSRKIRRVVEKRSSGLAALSRRLEQQRRDSTGTGCIAEFGIGSFGIRVPSQYTVTIYLFLQVLPNNVTPMRAYFTIASICVSSIT